MGGFQTGSRPVKSAALLACVALLASAQEPVIRVSVDLVQIDAGVTDSQGHHVADLKPEDFQVLEDGKPQKITHFSYVSGSANPLPAYAGAEWNPEFAQRLRPQDVRRTIVLVADDLSYGPAEFPRARTALKEFVDREMQPGDLVSIMTTSGGMGALEQLTNDNRALTAAIRREMNRKCMRRPRSGRLRPAALHSSQPVQRAPWVMPFRLCAIWREGKRWFCSPPDSGAVRLRSSRWRTVPRL